MDKRFDRLPVAMQEAITALKELHGTPDEMALQVVLGVANAAAMKMYNVDSRKYGVRPINEYFICMAPTGAMKSTNYKELLPGVERFEDYKQDELREEPVRYALDKKVFAREEAAYLKAMETDPSTAVLPKPLRPIETAKYIISKATVNGITNQLKSQSFVGLFSSEAGEFFNGHSFQGGKDNNKAVEMSASLTSMWDGHSIEKLTGMETTTLKNRRVNMLFLLQAETIQAILNTPIFSEQGFIHRMLITQCDYYEKPEWQFTPASVQQEDLARARLEEFHLRIGRMMHHPIALKKNTNFELDLPTMKQSDAAWIALGQWRNDGRERGTGDLRNYSGFAERLHEHSLRIAATIAAFNGHTEVTEPDALCAIDIMEFYIEQRRKLEVGIAAHDPNRSSGANKLYEWLVLKGWSGSQRELIQFGPGWYRKLDVDQRNQILTDLLSDELISVQDGMGSNGRRVKRIVLQTATSVAAQTP